MNYTIWLDESAGLTATTSMPVVYIHSFRGNGEDVWQACREMPGCPPMVLVSVNNPGGGLDDELSPWPAPAVWKGQAPYKGQATEHLKWMKEECMPEVEARLKAMGIQRQTPMIAGYSLAGLFECLRLALVSRIHGFHKGQCPGRPHRQGLHFSRRPGEPHPTSPHEPGRHLHRSRR